MPRPPLSWSLFASRMTPERCDVFWTKVQKGAPEECWEWIGSRARGGYGTFQVRPNGQGPTHAHRVAFAIANGGIDDGLYVCHKCDNPPCCNPAHLFAGTHKQNMEDMKAKGRAGWSNYVPADRCSKGHLFTPETARILGKTKRGFDRRQCLLCERERNAVAWVDRRLRHVARLHREIAPLLPATIEDLIEAVGSVRAYCIAAYYGVFGQAQRTLEEIGAELHVTRERVRQQRNAGIARLRSTQTEQAA